MVPTFIQAALDGVALAVSGDGHQVRSFCHVEDTVAAIVAMGSSLHPGPINIGGTEEISILNLAARVLRITGSCAGIRYVTHQPGDSEARCPDTSAARALLGWQPHNELADGLAATVQAQIIDRLLQEAQARASGGPLPLSRVLND